MRKYFLLFICLLLLSSCVLRQDVYLFPGETPRDIWDSVIDVFMDNKYEIQSVDKGAGTIYAIADVNIGLGNEMCRVDAKIGGDDRTGGKVDLKYTFIDAKVPVFGGGEKESNRIKQLIFQYLKYVPKIDSEYDRFNDKTTIKTEMRIPVIDYKPNILLSAEFQGKELTNKPKFFIMSFVSTTTEWRFLNFNDTAILADGERLILGKPNRESSVKPGYVSEFLSFIMEVQTLDKLAAAKVIEIKIGNYEFLISRRELAAIQEFKKVIESN